MINIKIHLTFSTHLLVIFLNFIYSHTLINIHVFYRHVLLKTIVTFEHRRRYAYTYVQINIKNNFSENIVYGMSWVSQFITFCYYYFIYLLKFIKIIQTRSEKNSWMTSLFNYINEQILVLNAEISLK